MATLDLNPAWILSDSNLNCSLDCLFTEDGPGSANVSEARRSAEARKIHVAGKFHKVVISLQQRASERFAAWDGSMEKADPYRVAVGDSWWPVCFEAHYCSLKAAQDSIGLPDYWSCDVAKMSSQIFGCSKEACIAHCWHIAERCYKVGPYQLEVVCCNSTYRGYN